MKINRPFYKLLIILFFISFGLTTFACNPFYGEELQNLKVLHDKTFESAPGKDLNLQAFSGDVYITTSNTSQVKIRILGNEKASSKIKFTFDNSENGVTVKAEKKGKWSFFNFGNGIKLKFEVSIPQNYNVYAKSSGGDISLSTLVGKANLKSSGGDISVHQITGDLNVTTSGGDISVDKNKGSLKLTTSGGEITCNDFNGNTDVHSSGGNLRLNGGNGQVEASTSGGDITLNYEGNNNGIELKSSGGDIQLRIPADFNADANMYTSGGNIHCDLKNSNVKRMSSSRYEADLNNGGNKLSIKTSGGDISVESR